MSLKIAEKGCEVHGIDLSEDAINSAKRLAEREMTRQMILIGER